MSDEDIFGDHQSLDKSLDSDAENKQVNGDENDEDTKSASKKKKTEKTKTVIRKPTLKLNADRICNNRGILALEGEFKQVNFKGRGHEGEDLELVLTGLEHWTYRLFPNLCFGDCIERIEKLGAQRAVQGYMSRVRMDLLESVLPESPTAENEPAENSVPKDAFDEFISNYSKENVSANVSQDQLERMNENKRRAEEKRKSRLLHTSTNDELDEKIDG